MLLLFKSYFQAHMTGALRCLPLITVSSSSAGSSFIFRRWLLLVGGRWCTLPSAHTHTHIHTRARLPAWRIKTNTWHAQTCSYDIRDINWHSCDMKRLTCLSVTIPPSCVHSLSDHFARGTLKAASFSKNTQSSFFQSITADINQNLCATEREVAQLTRHSIREYHSHVNLHGATWSFDFKRQKRRIKARGWQRHARLFFLQIGNLCVKTTPTKVARPADRSCSCRGEPAAARRGRLCLQPLRRGEKRSTWHHLTHERQQQYRCSAHAERGSDTHREGGGEGGEREARRSEEEEGEASGGSNWPVNRVVGSLVFIMCSCEHRVPERSVTILHKHTYNSRLLSILLILNP